MKRAANPKNYLVEMNYDWEWQTVAYTDAMSAKQAVVDVQEAARKKGWSLIDQAKWRATPQKNPKRCMKACTEG